MSPYESECDEWECVFYDNQCDCNCSHGNNDGENDCPLSDTK